METTFSGGHRLFSALLASATVVLAACATVDSRPAEDTVRARAQQRWDALVKGDLKTAYDLMSPGSRSAQTPEQYAATLRPGFYKAATVDKVICDTAERCEAHLSIEYDHRGTRFKTPLKDVWIKDSGNWWFLRQ